MHFLDLVELIDPPEEDNHSKIKCTCCQPSVTLVSVKIPRSTPIAAIALKALSRPAFWPQWMLYIATKKYLRPSAHDGGWLAIVTMGFEPKARRPAYIEGTTTPLCQSDSTIHPMGEECGNNPLVPTTGRGYGSYKQGWEKVEL